MSDKKQQTGRRKVLKLLGTGAVGSATIPKLSQAGGKDSVAYETLRGTAINPVGVEEVRATRRRFGGKHARKEKGRPDFGYLGTQDAFGEDQIIGYNVVSGSGGGIREQYITRGDSSSGGTVGTASTDDAGRLRNKADTMLEDAKKEEAESASSSLSTSSTEVDWNSWAQFASTDVYHEFPRMDYDKRPGAVKFENDVRASFDNPRIGARSALKMEPGRQICNSSYENADQYCTTDVVQDGFLNRNALVYHDWDKEYNQVPTDDLIEDDDPDNQLSSVTQSRSVSLQLSASKSGPSGTIGYSSSVSIPGAELIDKTTQATGQTKHELEISAPGETSARNNAEFEIGSIAEWEPSCGSQSGAVSYLDINVDLQWGLDVFGNWGNSVSDSKDFSYYTNCY